MKPIPKKIFAAFLSLFLFSAHTEAALQVFPTRLFLNARKRVAQLTLRHVGNKAETYHISTIFYKMQPDGGVQQVENPSDEERPLLKFLRFSPREVTLPPNIEQTVKVMVIPSGNISEGEYRAHIKFEPKGDDDSGDPNNGGKDVAMKLSARVAIAVPVFYAQGSPELKTSVKDFKLITLEDQKQGFQAEVQAEGKKFLYGDIRVWFSPKNGKTIQVGTVLGISSYVPKRNIRFPLTIPDGVNLKNGVLKLDLNETAEEGGKLLATTETALP